MQVFVLCAINCDIPVNTSKMLDSCALSPVWILVHSGSHEGIWWSMQPRKSRSMCQLWTWSGPCQQFRQVCSYLQHNQSSNYQWGLHGGDLRQSALWYILECMAQWSFVPNHTRKTLKVLQKLMKWDEYCKGQQHLIISQAVSCTLNVQVAVTFTALCQSQNGRLILAQKSPWLTIFISSCSFSKSPNSLMSFHPMVVTMRKTYCTTKFSKGLWSVRELIWSEIQGGKSCH